MRVSSRPAQSLRPEAIAFIIEPVAPRLLSYTRQKFTAALLALSLALAGTAEALPLWSGGFLARGPSANSWNFETLAPGEWQSQIILAESVPEPEPPSCPDKKSSRAGRAQGGNGEARIVWRKSAQCTYKLTQHGKKVPCNGVAQFADFIFLGLLFD